MNGEKRNVLGRGHSARKCTNQQRTSSGAKMGGEYSKSREKGRILLQSEK